MTPVTRRRKVKGERRHGAGWEVYVRVHGELRRKTFPIDSTPEQRHAWRIAQRHTATPSAPKGSIGRDAVRTLATLKHLPSYADKENYLRHWVNHFGKYTPRATITSAEIAAELSRLQAEDDLAPTTARHYRTALQQVWEVCDGKHAPNPVRDTPRPKDRPAQPRAANIDHVRQVLERLAPGSLTRARLRVILTTGLPHAQVMQLTPADWDRTTNTLRVTARKKGGGTSARYLPLSAAAVDALAEFAKVGAWGKFSQSAMHTAVHRACDRLKLPRFRPYDLRHTMGTLIYQETGDLATTARMLGHTDHRTAARYTQDAFAAVDRAAVAKVGKKLSAMFGKRQKGGKS